MKTIYYRNLRDKKVQEIETFRVGAWVHLEVPTEAELSSIQKKFNLEEGLLKDALDMYEVPRMEIEEGNIYIFSRYPLKRNGQIGTAPILFVIADEVIITISNEPFSLLEGFIHRYEFYTTQKNKMLLQLFKLINTAFSTYFHAISREVRSSAYELEKITNKDIVLFVNYERVLNDFHMALIRKNTVLNTLLTHTHIKFYEEDKELIEDIALSNDQIIQLSKENLQSIVNIRDAYTTILTNNTNRVIRFFTSVTVLLTVPMVISSIYGMNVALPFGQSPGAFAGIMLTILGITTALVVVFIFNDWL